MWQLILFIVLIGAIGFLFWRNSILEKELIDTENAWREARRNCSAYVMEFQETAHVIVNAELRLLQKKVSRAHLEWVKPRDVSKTYLFQALAQNEFEPEEWNDVLNLLCK